MTEGGNNPNDGLRAGLAELDKTFDAMQMVYFKAEHQLEEIKILLIGKRIRSGGYIYQITQARIHWDRLGDSLIHCYGVRYRNGKAGTRGYSLGAIDPAKLLR